MASPSSPLFTVAAIIMIVLVISVWELQAHWRQRHRSGLDWERQNTRILLLFLLIALVSLLAFLFFAWNRYLFG